MKLHFSGFEQGIDISQSKISVLEIENKVLFTRICQSLLSERGEVALEPFVVWDDNENEVLPDKVFEVVASPFDLPWSGREFAGKLYAHLESLVFEEDELRNRIEALNRELFSSILSLNLQTSSDYAFAVEWDIRKYLKTFGFGVDVDSEDKLLDNIIKFIEMAVDVGFEKVLVFMNLKSYFGQKELETLYGQVIFLGIRVVLLEAHCDKTVFEHEEKYCIDQHFLQ
jgi:CRISPR-associated protein Csn2